MKKILFSFLVNDTDEIIKKEIDTSLKGIKEIIMYIKPEEVEEIVYLYNSLIVFYEEPSVFDAHDFL